jgi:5-methylthioadenosine/S-adenosylhomocysteine deaminase
LVIHDALIVTIDPAWRIIENGTLIVEDGHLTDVRPTAPEDRDAQAEVVIDASGHLIMPGLVDATGTPISAWLGACSPTWTRRNT